MVQEYGNAHDLQGFCVSFPAIIEYFSSTVDLFALEGVVNALFHWVLGNQCPFVPTPKFSVLYRLLWSVLLLTPSDAFMERRPVFIGWRTHVPLDTTSKMHSSSPIPLSLILSVGLIWITVIFLKCVTKIEWVSWRKSCSLAIEGLVIETD